MDSKINIRFVIDGVYSYHIDKFLQEEYRKQISWKGVVEYIKNFIYSELVVTNPVISIKSKAFYGTKENEEDKNRLSFYTRIGHANIEKRELALRSVEDKGFKEDAVDSTLITDTIFSYFTESKFDYLVLFAGDSDFYPFINYMRNIGVKVIVIYMDCNNHGIITRTSQTILEEADEVINIKNLAIDRVNLFAQDFFCPALQSQKVQNENQQLIKWSDLVQAILSSRKKESGYWVGDVYRNLTRIMQVDRLPERIDKIIMSYKDRLEFNTEQNTVIFSRDIYKSEIFPNYIQKKYSYE